MPDALRLVLREAADIWAQYLRDSDPTDGKPRHRAGACKQALYPPDSEQGQ